MTKIGGYSYKCLESVESSKEQLDKYYGTDEILAWKIRNCSSLDTTTDTKLYATPLSLQFMIELYFFASKYFFPIVP